MVARRSVVALWWAIAVGQDHVPPSAGKGGGAAPLVLTPPERQPATCGVDPLYLGNMTVNGLSDGIHHDRCYTVIATPKCELISEILIL